MVQHDRCLREGARERDQPRDLMEVEPGVVGQAERREMREAGAEAGAVQHVLRRRVGRVQHRRVGIPGRDVADAAETLSARTQMRLQHRTHRIAEAQVSEADDAGADPHIAVDTARAHRRDAVGELRLADRLHRFRPVGAVHGAGLHEDGGADVVAGADIGEDFVQQITPARPVPEVMMRIDDALRGIERFLRGRGQPIRADGDVVLWRRLAHRPATSGSFSSGAMLPGMPSSKAFSVRATMQ